MKPFDAHDHSTYERTEDLVKLFEFTNLIHNLLREVSLERDREAVRDNGQGLGLSGRSIQEHSPVVQEMDR